MHLINVIVIDLYRKYGVSLHNLYENWTRGTSHLKNNNLVWLKLLYLLSVCLLVIELKIRFNRVLRVLFPVQCGMHRKVFCYVL